MSNGLIIAGYPGVGKTSYAETHEDTIDLDSYAWGGGNWYDVYTDRAVTHAKEGKVVLISTHEGVLKLLNKATDKGIKVVVVHPTIDLKFWWVERLKFRANMSLKNSDGKAYDRAYRYFEQDQKSLDNICHDYGFENIRITKKEYNFGTIVDYLKTHIEEIKGGNDLPDNKLGDIVSIIEKLNEKVENLAKKVDALGKPNNSTRNYDYMEDFMYDFLNIWQDFPELRFGQLICNVLRDPSLYYIEDKDLLEKMEEYYEDLNQNLK